MMPSEGLLDALAFSNPLVFFLVLVERDSQWGSPAGVVGAGHVPSPLRCAIRESRDDAPAGGSGGGRLCHKVRRHRRAGAGRCLL